MKVIRCPHCKASIKYAGAQLPRKVVCPGCKEAFAVQADKSKNADGDEPRKKAAAASQTAKRDEDVEDDFEVVDDEPSDSKDRKNQSKNRDNDDRDDGRKAKRKNRDDDDDRENDRNKKSERIDEDDDEEAEDRDSARKKKSKSRDDEDDRDYDRKKKSKSRDDDDESDDRASLSEATPEQIQKTVLGLKLLAFAFWAQVGAFGALTLLAVGGGMLSLDFVANVRFLVALGGIPNGILAIAGSVCLLRGFRKGNLATWIIVLLSVSSLYFLFSVYLTFLTEGKGISSLLVARGSKGSILWELSATLFFHCQFVAVLGIFDILLVLGTVFELCRFVFIMLVLKQYAVSLGDKRNRTRTVVLGSALLGTFVISSGLFALLLSGTPSKSNAMVAVLVLAIAFLAYASIYDLAARLCGKLRRKIEEFAPRKPKAAREEKKKKKRETD